MTLITNAMLNTMPLAGHRPLESSGASGAASLHEIKAVNHQLWRVMSELRRILESPFPPSIDPPRFVRLFEQLRDGIGLHFTLEEACGYFDNPVSASPRLSHESLLLRAQHRALYLEISELVERAAGGYDRKDEADWIRIVAKAFLRFCRRFEMHEARENALLQQAYDEDLGGGD
ncbi:MAG: hypothetical protein RIS70_2403 [Planctomycetota bacterium]